MMPWYVGMPGWGMVLMTLAALVVFAVLAGGVYVLVRLLDDGGRQPVAAPTPQEILAQRLAHGEIGEEEYRTRLALLDQSRATRRA